MKTKEDAAELISDLNALRIKIAEFGFGKTYQHLKKATQTIGYELAEIIEALPSRTKIEQ